ncbi:MAG: hypothetical protein U0168_08915 [Nannocystaceae bacterium]
MRSSGAPASRTCSTNAARSLAVVERDEVDQIEQRRLGQRAQLGVDVAAAQRDHRPRRRRAQASGQPQRAQQVAGKRHRQAHELGLVLLPQRVGELVDHGVDDRGWSLERGVDRRKARRRRGQAFAVARQLEVRVDAVADRIGDVVDEQAREVLGAIEHAQLSERPRQRVVVVVVVGQGREATALGQQLAADDAQREAGIAALQQRHHRLDQRDDAGTVALQVRDRGAVAAPWQRREHALQARATEQPQEQRQAHVVLHHLGPLGPQVPTQAAGQVRRRGIRRVDLRHRRREQEDAQGLHACVRAGRPAAPG